MLQRALIKDLQNTTQVSPKVLFKLCSIAEMIICDDINELDILGDDILEIDIGIGKISFIFMENFIKYDFRPSESLENNIIKTLEEKINPIIISSENSLDKKLFNTYKELL